MKQLLFLFSLGFLVILGCDKGPNYISAFVKGRLTDLNSKEPIPNNLVYLMEAKTEYGNGVNPAVFEAWDRIDSTITNEKGEFEFSFQSRDIYNYGFYTLAEHFFDYHQIFMIGGIHYDGKVVPVTLHPKAYLRMRVLDEFPFSGIDSIRFSTDGPQPGGLGAFGNPIDTTLIQWIAPDEYRNISWFFLHEGKSTRAGDVVFCPSFDTCNYEIRF